MKLFKSVNEETKLFVALMLLVAAFVIAIGVAVYIGLKHEYDMQKRVESFGKQYNLSTEGVRDIRCISGYLHYLPDEGGNVFRYEPIINCGEK